LATSEEYPEADEEDILFSEEEENIEEERRTLSTFSLTKKDAINDESGILHKLEDIKLVIPGEETVPWMEILVISVDKIDLPKTSDDLDREKKFYDSARKGVLEAMARLNQLSIPRDRPDDYFAEMIKTDDHMSKVKGALLKEKRIIEQAQLRTKKRLESKYIKSSQASQHEKRVKEKKDETEAIRKWRKLKKKNNLDEDGFPEELLDPNSQLRKQMSAHSNPKQKGMTKAQMKAKKYRTYKKRSKVNTAASTNDMSDFSAKKNETRYETK